MIICRQKTKISKKHKAFIGLCAEANLCLNLRNKIEMLNLLVLNISWDIYFDMNYTQIHTYYPKIENKDGCDKSLLLELIWLYIQFFPFPYSETSKTL